MSYNWGNKNNSKNWTPDLRQKAYYSFLDHIAGGFCLDSWDYDDEMGNSLTYKTMLAWIKENPNEFPPETIDKAKCRSKKVWETYVYDCATGRNKEANVAGLQMVMRNKFGWDKPEKDNAEVSPEISQKFDSIMNLLSKAQKV